MQSLDKKKLLLTNISNCYYYDTNYNNKTMTMKELRKVLKLNYENCI
jgi:hypothetical protein